MKYFDWSEEKNKFLRETRDISFEEIVVAIESGCLLKTVEHPNKGRYPNQLMYVINIDNYAYLVPFVEDEEKIFLKTIIPSRKATRVYIIEEKGAK